MDNRIIKLSLIAIASITFLAVLVITFGNDSGAHRTNKELADATVKVLRPDERSGGTGVVLSSHETHSEILTNNHVCEVVAGGGTIVLDNGFRYTVVSYKQSEIHDLCLITVNANLYRQTKLASQAPSLYSDATVSGHPALYPTIITKGHFSGKEIAPVTMGIKECTEDDLNGPNAIYCLFFGGIPIVRFYELQLISATIMPGSSGSAVYNENGELAGLVFAGQGNLGYGMIVPYEYVANFLNKELPLLESKHPNTTRSIASIQDDSKKKKKVNCSKLKDKNLKEVCKIVNRFYY